MLKVEAAAAKWGTILLGWSSAAADGSGRNTSGAAHRIKLPLCANLDRIVTEGEPAAQDAMSWETAG